MQGKVIQENRQKKQDTERACEDQHDKLDLLAESPSCLMETDAAEWAEVLRSRVHELAAAVVMKLRDDLPRALRAWNGVPR